MSVRAKERHLVTRVQKNILVACRLKKSHHNQRLIYIEKNLQLQKNSKFTLK